MSLRDKLIKNSTVKLTNTLADSTVFTTKDMIPTSVPMINVALSGESLALGPVSASGRYVFRRGAQNSGTPNNTDLWRTGLNMQIAQNLALSTQIEQADRLVCVEKDFLVEDGGGELMFDPEGKSTERWEPISKLLEEYERDLQRTREMCEILADYALLEPFTLQATLKDKGPMNLSGMYRVDEKKLEFLNAAQHKNLIKKGIMGRIFAHLISLESFARLLARKAAVQAA